jgi:hypothetical protein
MITNLVKTGFALILTTMSVKAQAQTAHPPIDFNAVNGIIQEVITNSVKPDKVIKGVALTIDPASNLEQGKIDARFAAVLGVTPWEKTQDSGMSLELGTRFRDLNSLSKEGAFKIKAQAKTPVLAMIRYFSAKALEHRSSENPDFYASTLKKLAEVKNIAELYQIAVEIKQHVIETPDDQEEKEFAQNLRFTAKTVDGVVQSFKVEQTKPIAIGFAGIEIRKAAIAMNAKSMSAGLIFVTEVKTEMFNQYVEQSTVFLAELQARNEEVLKYIEDSVSGYIKLVREFLTN